MAVPKKKPSKVQTKTRFRAWVTKFRKKLTNRTNLTTCEHCGEKRINHHYCPNCQHYKDKNFSKKKTNIGKEKTTIKI